MEPGKSYHVVEVVGTSPEGVDAAIRQGVADAGASGRKLDWFEVREVRGFIQDGEVDYFQVRMGVGYSDT